MTLHGGDYQDVGLERLQRQYPRWRIWRGEATGEFWAMPPPGHRRAHELISAKHIDELARRLAETAERYDP